MLNPGTRLGPCEVETRPGDDDSDAETQELLFTVDREIEEFEVTPDGQRFLLLLEPPPFLPMQVVVNWPALLRR
jgi:hypothetical protein